MDEVKRYVSIETNILAYTDYLPNDWADSFLRLFPEGSVLERVVLDLGLAWRSAAYTAQMPATSIQAVRSGMVGFSNYRTKNAGIADFADKVLLKVAEEVPQIVANPTIRNGCKAALVRTATKFRNAAQSASVEVPIEPMWEQFLTTDSFRLSLWSSQRLAYMAFYNAYEAFVVDSLKVATGASSLRVTDKKPFRAALRTAFGEDIAARCWDHQGIELPRLVRHAISHNGGRLTKELIGKPHGIHLIDQEMHVYPADIKRALWEMRKATEHIVKLAAKLAVFFAPWGGAQIADDSDD